MADDPQQVTRDFTAGSQSTDALTIRGEGRHHVTVHIETGDLVGTIDLEARRPGGAGGSGYEVIEQYSSFPVWKTVEIAGGWDFRLTSSAYTSGSANGWLVA